MPKNGEHFIFLIADGTVELSGRDQVFRRATSIQDHPARGEEHNDDFQRESDGLQRLDTLTDDGETRKDLWTISSSRCEPSVKLYCWKAVLTMIGTLEVARI